MFYTPNKRIITAAIIQHISFEGPVLNCRGDLKLEFSCSKLKCETCVLLIHNKHVSLRVPVRWRQTVPGKVNREVYNSRVQRWIWRVPPCSSNHRLEWGGWHGRVGLCMIHPLRRVGLCILHPTPSLLTSTRIE
jgi:hypothetical protein